MRTTSANRWAIAFVAGLTPAIGCTTVQPVAYPAPPTATAPPATARADVSPANEQLDQITAPIALYPDALLAQVLMAATYPDQVIKAAEWSKQHPDVKGDEAVKLVESQPWDPSVQSLVAFPDALATMAQKPEWVKQLGEAFLAQPDDVMNSVQRLRAMAQQSGNLKSNEQQKIETDTSGGSTVIAIEPAQPNVVYVPSYNPSLVYGAWPYAAYPPVYLPPPVGYGYPVGAGLATGLAFGVGIAATSALWGGVGWGHHGHHNVNVNVNRYNQVNSNRKLNANQGSWTRNNQARINNARTNGATGQRARAQQTVQRRQPGAYQGGAAQRTQGMSRGTSGRAATGAGNYSRPPGASRPSGGYSGGAARGRAGGGGGRRH